MPIINKDTTLCISLSARPSNFGTRFHNHLYDALGLNYIYKGFATADLPGAIAGVRALGIRGCAISMPFKQAVIELVDALDPSASAIGAVNTIVNDAGHLRAYNTDYIAVQKLIASHGLKRDMSFALRGSGGMARAVASAFRDAGFASGHIIARNATTGGELARATGYPWQADMTSLRPQLLINVTPIGMTGGPEADHLAFDRDQIEQAQAVFDVVAFPSETPLIRQARALGRPVITGLEVVALQAVEQFVLYTGHRPTDAQIHAAVAWASRA